MTLIWKAVLLGTILVSFFTHRNAMGASKPGKSVASATTAAPQSSAPLGFRQYLIGISKAEAEALARSDGGEWYAGDLIWQTEVKGADVSVLMRFPRGRLEWIEITCRHGDYDLVLASVYEKHGKPTSAKTDKMQNGFGAIFERRSVLWEVPAGSVFAMEFLTDREQSHLWIKSRAQEIVKAEARAIRLSGPGL